MVLANFFKMCRFSFFIFLVFVFTKVVVCLKNVILDIEPSYVLRGDDARLRCTYDLGSDPLYCVKWYRGTREFYRYTPKEAPSTKIFPFDGVHVDLKQSNKHQVVLREVGFSLSGVFTCEVTTDAPNFTTIAVSKEMHVVALPKHGPTLKTDKVFYDVGDVLRANCSSPPSRPAVTLTFILNNVVVCEKCVTHKHVAQDLWWSSASLQFPLFPSNFINGRLALECIARMADLYHANAQIVLYNDKEPVPERVTHNAAAGYSVRIFSVNLILIILLL